MLVAGGESKKKGRRRKGLCGILDVGFLLIWHIGYVLLLFLLGSKDLGFYVFRTLMCIVGKSWSKQYV